MKLKQFLLIIGTALGMLGLFLIFTNYTSIFDYLTEQKASGEYQLLTQNLSSKIQTEVVRLENEVNGVADALSELTLIENESEIDAIIKALTESEGVEEVIFCDNLGKGKDTDGLTYDVSFCPYYQRALIGDTTITWSGFEKEEDLSVLLTVPVKKNDEVIYVLRVKIPENYISSNLTISNYRGKESIFLVDRAGNVIMTSTGMKASVKNVLDLFEKESSTGDDFLQIIKQGRDKFEILEEDLTESSFGRTPFYFAYSGVADTTEWGVCMLISWDLLGGFYEDSSVNDTERLINYCVIGVTALSLILFAFAMKEAISRDKMHKLAYYDEVTGSDNFNSFKRKSRAILSKNQSLNVAIIVMGLVKYDYLREFFGEDESNRVLTEISNRLSMNVKGNECFCHNFGNEFDLCVQYHNVDELRDRIKFINESLESITQTLGDTEKYNVALDYGICCREKKEDDLDTLFSRANIAFMTAKTNPGGNLEFYSDKMLSRMLDEKEIEKDMYEALENHDFLVYLQPKFDLVTGLQVGGEALVRWMHAEKGLMYPGRFIGTFEKNGFIVRLDMYILEELCRRIKVWMSKGYRPTPCSLNISRLNLFNKEFVKEAIAIVEQYGVPAHLIIFEMSEAVVSENITLLSDIIAQLKSYGFIVSMDNFGTGSTSMNTLYSVPVDELKIDRKFLLSAEKTDRGQNVIQSVIEMAKRLDIRVVTEGVENKQQALLLRELGCDMIQGFAFSEPLPEHEYEDYAYGPRARENNIW
ncbi:MAG: EAL domain-containing protein [Lachnospiraceae bacterium]|nr:EAL domain-containing protein [Lachnospiraceae bacterium]